jgi:hypothetical protein
MPDYARFSDEAVSTALETGKRHYEGFDLAANTEISAAAASRLSLNAECISVVVDNNQICLELPFNIGNTCIPIPISISNGTPAQACLNVCYHFIPTGVCVEVTVLGATVAKQCFGDC